MMNRHELLIASILLFSLPSIAFSWGDDGCCGNKGGIFYCDSSGGRYVCRDGDYSSCYCDRHAIMDLQKIQGCCVWQGGIFKVDNENGLVICNNGGISEICSIQHPSHVISLW